MLACAWTGSERRALPPQGEMIYIQVLTYNRTVFIGCVEWVLPPIMTLCIVFLPAHLYQDVQNAVLTVVSRHSRSRYLAMIRELTLERRKWTRRHTLFV